jgi:hypothetical protein
MFTSNVRNQQTYAPLSNDQLRRIAPSIFADRPYAEMSAKYEFIPTSAVVERLRAEGFQPFRAGESRARIEEKRGFTKHMIRFRDMRSGDRPTLTHLGQLFPELVLINSHDGESSYHLTAGIFRLVCMNGMVVADSTFEAIKVWHFKGMAAVSRAGVRLDGVDGVIEASYRIAEQFPQILSRVEQFAQLPMSARQQEAFATSALELKYGSDEPAPLTPTQILTPRRREDSAPNLWNTFNRVQESLLKGGTSYVNRGTMRRQRTRAVKGIAEDVRLNRGLWTLAEAMQSLIKGGAGETPLAAAA